MTKKLLVVTKMPIEELFDQDQTLMLRRVRDVGSAEIKELLRQGPLRFVVANVGMPLNWIVEAETFQYWKQKVTSNLFEVNEGSDRFRLEDYPNQYVYCASEWAGASYRVILLEMHH